jgi:ABC-type multidrug transport system fused ATPase/permease subunit
LRSSIGVVLQENYFFSGTVRENISLTKRNASIEEIIYAAKLAGADEFVQKLPRGYDTVLEENASNLSGGQKQRLAIARALLTNPRILIFDEATSALDNHTQAIVTESLNKLNTTRLVIAHRLSTIKECDRILVMDKGSIVESGSYEELLSQNGVFAQLVKRQVA